MVSDKQSTEKQVKIDAKFTGLVLAILSVLYNVKKAHVPVLIESTIRLFSPHQ